MSDKRSPAVHRTFLDRMIGKISPVAEARRFRARASLAALERAFEGASQGGRNKGWGKSNGDANSEISGSLPVLRARSRDLVRNNPWARRALSVVTSNTVGTGIIPQARASSPGLAKKYEDLWISWGDETLCDADGRHDFYGLQSLAMDTIVESGAVLVRRRWRSTSEGLPVPLQIQVLEPDFLDTTKDGPISGSSNVIVGGVELDRRGRRVAYWLYEEHPGARWPMKGSLKSFRVPASDILHVFRQDRPGQIDGIPWVTPAILRLRDLDNYEDAQLMRQTIAACFAAFEHDLEALDETLPTDPKKLAELESIQPGTIKRLPPGKTITFGSPPAAEGYAPYTATVLRSIACAFGITYESMTNDYSNVNFSSGRMGWIEMARNVDRWRHQMLIAQFCRGVWQWFTEAAVVSGAAPDFAAATWTPPRREMLDPVKETEALKAQIRTGILTPSEAVRQSGRDFDAVLAEYQQDLAKIDAHGLVFDSDARKAPAVGGGAAKQKEEKDEKEDLASTQGGDS